MAGPESLADAFSGHPLSLSSRAVHADDYINSSQAVAPPMHVSTTFRFSEDPSKLKQCDNIDVSHVNIKTNMKLTFFSPSFYFLPIA